MDKRRFTRLVGPIFSAALLFAASGVAPVAASPIVPHPSINSAERDRDDNDVECKGGKLTRMGNTTTCEITQTKTSGNHAECNLSGNRPDETQICKITQTSGAGNNEARTRMRIGQEKTGPLPFSGVCVPYPTRALTLSNQNGCQILIVNQTSVSGSNSLEAELTIEQEIDKGNQQRQNAGQHHKVNQASQTGAQLAKLDLSQTQQEEAEVRADQFQRSTGGRVDQHSTITQNSAGISRYVRNFRPHQVQEAPAGSTQTQDPDDWCCSGQGSNLADSANLSQIVTQTASLGTARQNDRLTGNTSPTTGIGTVNQSVTRTRAGVTDTTPQNCSQRGGCFIILTCGLEGCFTGGD